MAVVGVSAAETQATVDGIVSTAVLWMEYCHERYAARTLVEGARLSCRAAEMRSPACASRI